MDNFWHRYSKDCRPKKDGKYFVVHESYAGDMRFPDCVYFANNLRRQIDIGKDELDTKYGFYFSDSEWGDIPLHDVILWADIPDYEEA